MRDKDVQQLLERVGNGLSSGDLKAVAACWGFPSLAFFDDSAESITGADDIAKLFSRTSDTYRARGIVSTRPEIQHMEKLNGKLMAVDVQWPSFDASGAQKANERSHYIVAMSGGGPEIRVALSRSSSAG